MYISTNLRPYRRLLPPVLAITAEKMFSISQYVWLTYLRKKKFESKTYVFVLDLILDLIFLNHHLNQWVFLIVHLLVYVIPMANNEMILMNSEMLNDCLVVIERQYVLDESFQQILLRYLLQLLIEQEIEVDLDYIFFYSVNYV